MNIENTTVENKLDTTSTEQFVTFIIGNETYGIEVLKVQEIIGMTRITYVPNTLPYMKGVINLRGSVVPVIDMRKKIGMDEIAYNAFTVIIITEVKGKLIGMIVDSVQDVVTIPIQKIQDTIHFTSQIATDYIKGIGQIDNNLVIILDVDRLLTADEIAYIKNI
ncbi:MAG TPA: chemotaxis protein CheW [Spirochaetota bacterium]|jgi:purine-binding chemotaxis protein CheW|nr:purine-binding chemotaxis protein CheW [Spirochaetota bacterium]HOM87850.1 chemotaxis protein CheW [Spirochaetota bacterium]HOR94833.1 chemotaxis protein CheW [Spirochaetota bacterium]HOT19371.1 chemotaxis protein CheW [Spirochaetota bacterium]HPD06036.1 chemotaxis protein CheW [Spirochaetota bacterium]